MRAISWNPEGWNIRCFNQNLSFDLNEVRAGHDDFTPDFPICSN